MGETIGSMEKFFSKHLTLNIEVWQIGLALIAAVLGVIGFGALVEKGATDENAPWIARASSQIARIPAESRNVFKTVLVNQHRLATLEQRFEGESGFQRFKAGSDEALLLARYDGDRERAVVEIVDLENGAILHKYEPDFLDIPTLSAQRTKIPLLQHDPDPKSFLINHPLLTEDGGLIFNGMYKSLAKIDVCSNVVWTLDGFYHHAIERDADGNYWTGAVLDPPQHEVFPAHAFDDAIVNFSPDGEILFEKSLATILVENNLKYFVYSSQVYIDDALHLNDVQPVLEDGQFWRRGDLFLSLRNRSAIMLYRPSTNKIIWYRQGPWMMQHDVDIVDDSKIAIFDNNTARFYWDFQTLGVNNTMVYDFSTEETTTPFSKGYEVNEIRSVTEGRSEILPDGEIFVEEQNFGRLLKMNTVGDVAWQFVNRANNGKVFVVSWVRYIEKARARRAAEIAAEKCSSRT